MNEPHPSLIGSTPPAKGPLSVLIFAVGTAGDVYPNIAIGRALRRRGAFVRLAANSYFEASVRRAGLEFISMGDTEEYLRVTADPELWQWGKGLKILLREMVLQVRPVYDTIVQHAMGNSTVVIAPASALGARLANEKLGVPLVSLHLQPMALRTLEDQPGVVLPRYAKPFVRPLRKLLLAALDRWLLHPLVLPGLNAFRSELQLAPLDKVFDGWIHSPQMIIGLFPEWFVARQPDWPPQLYQTGFPLYDDSRGEPMPAEVEEFLRAGDPPIVFAPGSGMQFAKPFFETSVEVCRLLGKRGILLTRFDQQIPPVLPDGVRHFQFVPHSQLLPRAVAVVHHGGIGTTAAACKAGIPQLVCPFNFDQPDNAARVQRLGVGARIFPARYRPERVARKLRSLLTQPTVTDRCKEIAALFDGANPIEDTCARIESLAVPLETASAAQH